MTHLWRNRKLWSILLLVIVVASVMLYASRGGPATKASSNVFRDIIAPAQSGIASGVNWFSGLFAGIGELGRLRQDNDRLRQENEQLRQAVTRAQEIQQENIRLKGLLDYRYQAPEYTTVAAKIIGWDPSNWSSHMLLNVGTQQGVKKDMAVITPQGVVGRIVQSSLTTSEVILLTDEASSIGARVNPSRSVGIIRGSGGSSPTLRLSNLPQDAVINPGDQVLSSGLGGVYPPGLVIGTVVSVNMEQSGLLKVAQVKPAVSFNRLDEVLVVIQASAKPGS